MRRRWNIPIWAGFAVVLLALISYIPIFSLFPVTRDFPWVNLLLFLIGFCLLALGLNRAFREPNVDRGKVAGPILTVISLAVCCLFCYGVFVASKDVPRADNAPRIGQAAPDFALASVDGSQVALSELLKRNSAVLLIFYRG
jgi:hypothetical protein